MGIHNSPSSSLPLQPSGEQPPSITTVNHTLSETPSQPSDFPSKPQINGLKLTRKIKKRVVDETSSASSSSSIQRGIRIPNKRKNPRFSVRRSATDVEAIAFPLGMSIAAVLAQILEKKDLTNENVAVDHLAMICTSAVRESLTNVFGDKFDAFARNFEKSFGSTLSTLRLIKNSSVDVREDQVRNDVGDCISGETQSISVNNGDRSAKRFDIADGCTIPVNHSTGAQGRMKTVEEEEDIQSADSRNQDLPLQGHISSQIVISNMRNHLSNHSVLSTVEKSVIEQTRANDLKSVEIGLIMRKLQLKETQLALNSDLNSLERCKLSLGISRTSFKAEKFKNQLEETRHSELLKTCVDFLVADLLIMSGCLGYGVYAFSYDNLRQLSRSCSAYEVSKSWWIPKPMASFNSGLQTLKCEVQVYSRMLFGLLMILAIAYVLIQRSEISRQAMPITFLILLLGVGCGFAGKLCVDTLGGDGYQWLIYWEVLCLLHFFLNVFTPFFFYILNGPIQVSQERKSRVIFPFWMRRWLFYLILILIPVCCGFLPFASPRAWWEEHFSKLIRNYMLAAYDEGYDDGSGYHNHIEIEL
ncbi:protein CPR-5-like isoform X1 [Chenopodium quinoa]|uniref:protein CPR-5-like isoform X1 n=1 Tax=Chenopodium quinoa TaxID=63459 RepID=UPI000B78D21E|nr:protein CPR-5-like isoform X1 [Chenopodium quinoa]